MTSVGPRVRTELVPRPLWRRGLSNAAVLPSSKWRKLRRWAVDRTGNCCEVCGYHAEGGKNLVCHEQWAYDDDDCTQTLTGVEIHCRDCDAVTDVGFTETFAGMIGLRKALSRLAEVNGWPSPQAMTYWLEARQTFQRRSQREWRQDIGWYERWVAQQPD